jgi:hypothetical protein
MDCGEVGDERHKGLENSKLDVDALAHGIAHRGNDASHCGMRDSLERDEALEGTQGDGDYFCVPCCASHEHRAQKIVGLRPI